MKFANLVHFKLDKIKQWFCNDFFQQIGTFAVIQIPFRFFLELLIFIGLLSPILILFSVQIFSLFSRLQLKLYGPENFISSFKSSFYYLTCVVSSRLRYFIRFAGARLVARLELKCNSFCIPTRVAISNYQKSFWIVQNDLGLLKINSSHWKIVFTILALRPSHRIELRLLQLNLT